MSCRHCYLTPGPDGPGDAAFSVESNQVTFGPSALLAAGDWARSLGCARVALFTDPIVAALPPVASVRMRPSRARPKLAPVIVAAG